MRASDLAQALIALEAENPVIVVVDEDTGNTWPIGRVCMTEDPGGPNGADEGWIVLGEAE